ncbi:formate dehydrogenase accessory sulfurtransferase FdhD [Paenibacillus alkaliterrae]|uniref:formate dehydrogenase accessory sulfurtransferase FdhD n=1 Tax=Paenibacillus alkaliterrae TaxID=320909 RepID=UPI001F4748E4|nr:formate dehydrogenase accessory sulfurtransferase FdhD [Paenibacillus alkaliterrae]MCF2938953.1 formate dehydrogenase accessory sulfurtransferase FdhD [Paenibacillus alkaliterrae]
MEHTNTTKWPILKYDGSELFEMDDEIAAEFPLTLKLDGEEFATIVCSPSDLQELVIGFLASEGVIRTAGQVKSLIIHEDTGFAYVGLEHKSSMGIEHYTKRVIGSCCGKSRQFYFHNDRQTAKTVMTRTRITPEQCIRLILELQDSSADFRSTGGVHNAAIGTARGLLIVRTDIGRHNALDKLFGYCLLHRLRTSDKVIAFSGRLSSEVVLKAAKIGCGILLSKSAPTDLALRLADDLGITCVGFIRGGEMNVYTHRERIDFGNGLTAGN